MDLRSVDDPAGARGFVNRSVISLGLVVVISVAATFYARQVEQESTRTRLLAETGKYEQLLQTELQHLIDLLYRSYGRTSSPDTPAITNSFPWVRGIGVVDTTAAEERPTRHHLLTLSLAEVSRSLGGQITFAVISDSDILLVLSRSGHAHTTRAMFSTSRLFEFVNSRIELERLGVGVKVVPSGPNEPGSLTTTLHLGMPGLEVEATLTENIRPEGTVGGVSSLVWPMIGALWLVWILLFLERRRRLHQQRLVAEQKSRIEAQAGRAVLAEVAGSIGHEINQPVAVIESLSDTASHLMENGEHRRASEVLGQIQSEALRVGQIIQAVRRLSSEEGMEFRDIDLVSVVRGLAPLARIICGDIQLSVITDQAHGRTMVSADQTAIEQVVINLIVNGCEALSTTSDDPATRPSVTVSLRSTADHAIVEVSDNGCGVPDSIRDEIFNSFVTTKPGGLGIGLNLSRSIAERHRGWLSLANTGGHGTTFELHLPLVK